MCEPGIRFDTWISTQLRLNYEHPDGRDAAFDIHTSWVIPDNFPGYVEQEVQFRFDNGMWNGHSSRRGVELTIEGKTTDASEDDVERGPTSACRCTTFSSLAIV